MAAVSRDAAVSAEVTKRLASHDLLPTPGVVGAAVAFCHGDASRLNVITAADLAMQLLPKQGEHVARVLRSSSSSVASDVPPGCEVEPEDVHAPHEFEISAH
mmetsp:Transcript_8084/g.33338  ORF Transcript_8084/g.33338 Transcript_8084/m.33338 type:complete len:102 (-) Transcript_8084:229-534(-)|eukprot:CAMPEP_0185699356 /NCGR_PEP_ID=MMETSP1164-20130828/6878_1 /TAXON_ID=1104430 /ORGANISM="Chrysoreinhardia sp, Strain CCMP2950" /LENGTH=101 /DNA_ID=CAMNT_0028366291 /DNA_START=68 /DNA_END=373 /DNA_ORIENTATION=+